jgi:hypothetical protein
MRGLRMRRRGRSIKAGTAARLQITHCDEAVVGFDHRETADIVGPGKEIAKKSMQSLCSSGARATPRESVPQLQSRRDRNRQRMKRAEFLPMCVRDDHALMRRPRQR